MSIPCRLVLFAAAALGCAALAGATALIEDVLVAPGARPLQVLTTLPDLRDIVGRIGGERVEARSIADGTENVHAVQIRPSTLVAAHRAQMFVQIGLSLEHAWVPGLLEAVRNPRIQPGAPSFVNTSAGWPAIDLPASVSRAEGADIHPQGNPHINLAHGGGRHIAAEVLAALERVDPEGREGYRARHAAYLRELDAAEARWRKVREELAGAAVVTYHTSFDYLLRDLGLELVGTIEPKPGVQPSPRHTAALVERMKARPRPPVILTAPWSNGSVVREIARRSGARVVEIPDMVGGAADGGSWIGMMDLVHERIRAACSQDALPARD